MSFAWNGFGMRFLLQEIKTDCLDGQKRGRMTGEMVWRLVLIPYKAGAL